MATVKRFESKIFDVTTEKGLKQAERYQSRLYNRYDSVEVHAMGFTRVKVVGQNKEG